MNNITRSPPWIPCGSAPRSFPASVFWEQGAILKHGSTISGLTTAASLWGIAAVGLFTGLGVIVPALMATFHHLFGAGFGPLFGPCHQEKSPSIH
ncbi:MAG: MgtC/SapB family protein [Bacillota bacterium]